MSKLHIDLFSGIGGFALAADTVFGDVEHIFCDYDEFCQKVLAKHWPESEIYNNVRTFITDADIERRFHGQPEKQSAVRRQQALGESQSSVESPFLLTGGFPCQPFSQAGLRRGTSDDRYLWPEMLAIIQSAQPTWVIAENVGGLATWDEGMVLEQVCTDLEATGYEVQPLIIPAVAVNAPHRRDRIWFVANRRREYGESGSIDKYQQGTPLGSSQTAKPERQSGASTDSKRPRRSRGEHERSGQSGQLDRHGSQERPDWSENWVEVAAELCRMDDGVPKGVDRARQLKAYGNAIVPQVAMEIMQAIRATIQV